MPFWPEGDVRVSSTRCPALSGSLYSWRTQTGSGCVTDHCAGAASASFTSMALSVPRHWALAPPAKKQAARASRANRFTRRLPVIEKAASVCAGLRLHDGREHVAIEHRGADDALLHRVIEPRMDHDDGVLAWQDEHALAAPAESG